MPTKRGAAACRPVALRQPHRRLVQGCAWNGRHAHSDRVEAEAGGGIDRVHGRHQGGGVVFDAALQRGHVGARQGAELIV
jgi:hypothetical protein